jgi:hypothetical protein
MQELTLSEFVSKLCVTLIPFVAAYVWVVIRSFVRASFLFSGVTLERNSVQEGRVQISKLQESTWSVNASQVQNFAAITVAIVLLVVVFVIEKTLNYWSETYLDLIILVVGFSCLADTFSLQFWNCALDKAPNTQWLLSQRRIATALQVIGWNGLYLSVVLCVSYADTFCGTTLSLIGAVGLVFTMELKAPYQMTKPQ